MLFDIMNHPDDIDLFEVERIFDLSGDSKKVRYVDFFLYFPTELDATNVEIELINLQFETEVNKNLYNNQWCCHANKKMVATEERLVDIGNWLEHLAEVNNGKYDG